MGNRALGGAVGNVYGGPNPHNAHGGTNAPAVGGGGHKPPPSGYKYGNAGGLG